METLLDTLLNGNLTDAKNKAKRYGFWTIVKGMEALGHNMGKSAAIAAYLKGKMTYNDYCKEMLK